jgi:hypothetical protein
MGIVDAQGAGADLGFRRLCRGECVNAERSNIRPARKPSAWRDLDEASREKQSRYRTPIVGS